MSATQFAAFFASSAEPLAVVLGTNEVATAVAVKLRRARFSVILSHDLAAPVIRRGMAFHDALFDDDLVIQGVMARRAENALEIADAAALRHCVAVTPLQICDLLALRHIAVLIDARMQERVVTPDFRYFVGLAIGLGPGFTVGGNCDVAIETNREHCGTILTEGSTGGPEGAPDPLGGAADERCIRAICDGVWHTSLDVGAPVLSGETLGKLGYSTIRAPLDGVLRGLARDGHFIRAGASLVEVDPRGRRGKWRGLDSRGRRIADATLAAIRETQKRRKRAPCFAHTRP
ncbi:xanthine dehydrogenase [Rhodoblastus sp.]|jgi:hypothetical protein|uniref:xanthine dehydrogenase n=1 Tax=Rhodoblastus sp. TaxID=1962975 RepID=UPI002608322A|nr:xanthine dehydrogenase [Rhodoblastus sp.]